MLHVARLSGCFRHTGGEWNRLPRGRGSLAVVGLVANGSVLVQLCVFGCFVGELLLLPILPDVRLS